ncbi:hypothetical protein [Micromonospora zhanjiangensis]|uniref:Uncharacterized protein n=1 Tax=Micromonospora zhanjiangensis TaxID=1522057 RepID=A0ABV8KRL8_9ACTN
MTALTDRIRSVRETVARATLTPLLVRFGVFASALAGLLLAYPVAVSTSRFVGLLVVVAVVPAVGPRRVWPTFVVLVTVGGWLLATAGYGESRPLWRVLALATAVYLTHSLGALAALVPYDAVVDPGVLVRWLSRAAGVVLAAGVLGVLLLAVGDRGGPRFLAAGLAGLLVAVLATVLLARLLRRR